jgi:hypothetical protein
VLGFDRHVPNAHDEGLRIERLAGVPGRAGLLAATAFGAGEAVEEVVPAEVGEGLEPEGLVLASRSIAGSSPRGASLRKLDVEEARDDVQVLAERQVHEECRNEGHGAHHRMWKAPSCAGVSRDRIPTGSANQRSANGVGDERAGLLAEAGDLEDLGQQLRSRRRRRSCRG